MASLRRVMRIVLSALVVVTALLTQGGAASACIPTQAVVVAQHAVQTRDAPRPLVPCDHGGAVCCMSCVCQAMAGWPAVLANAAPRFALSLTRYHAVAASLHDGLATAPTPPPPRPQI